MVQSLSTCVSPVASPDGQQLSASALPRVLGKARRLQSQSPSHSSAGIAAQTLPICGCCGPAHTTGSMVSATESGAPAGCQSGPHQHVPQCRLWGPLWRAWKGRPPGGKIPAKAGHTLSRRQWTLEIGITRKGQLGEMPAVSTLASQRNFYKE